jgi:hypothetical protein
MTESYSFLLPLLTIAHHTESHAMTFVDYILQSNVINCLIVATGLGVVLSKLNIPQKLDKNIEDASFPLQDAQFFRNSTEAQLAEFALKFQSLDQEKSIILQTAQQTADSITEQSTEKLQRLMSGLTTIYESKKQRESTLLQSSVLNQVVAQLFQEVEGALPSLAVCHERLVQLLIEELNDSGSVSVTPSDVAQPLPKKVSV